MPPRASCGNAAGRPTPNVDDLAANRDEDERAAIESDAANALSAP
jgi:hypothetical protein